MLQSVDISPGLLIALDGIYEDLRRDYPELPRALITVEEPHPAVSIRIACWRHGRIVTAAGVFEGRIAFIYPSPHRDVPRVLFTGSPAKVLGVLVHEAAHALATARGIKDTSRSGTWHNERYRDLAAELGLDVARNKSRGWADTTCPAPLLAKYERWLLRLEAALPEKAEGGTA
jgi:hypothetical protein